MISVVKALMYRFLLDETIGGSIISHATSALLSDFGKSGVPNLVKKKSYCGLQATVNRVHPDLCHNT